MPEVIMANFELGRSELAGKVRETYPQGYVAVLLTKIDKAEG